MASHKIKEWWDKLSEEERHAHVAKLRQARLDKAEARRRSRLEAVRTDAETACQFLDILREYIRVTTGHTGAGSATPLWCSLCAFRGTVFHLNGGPSGCDCVCHRARRALDDYDSKRLTESLVSVKLANLDKAA